MNIRSVFSAARQVCEWSFSPRVLGGFVEKEVQTVSRDWVSYIFYFM